MEGITSIGHVAIKVKDLDQTLAFYRDKLDFPEMLRLRNDDESTWLVYLRVTDNQYIEIFPGAEGDRAPGPNANAMNHLCLTVDDLDVVVSKLEQAGIVLTSPIKPGLDGNRQAWIADPDGNRIELMEMSPDCLQLKAIREMRAKAPA
ncbi:VOC family protein [Qingshengfaniella alkalisoli]|uniref:VOC family protein n=1 Tax=Qingshengfaniella alkalisoli TaxID=2599296 RepID=A0A5B8I8P5_9RHOB|nr:VOC family protein [Qingshengfaniella alkalisoli]QDY70435.1 VOC family protein [Qingshengfaniella alkalisoli]